MTPPEQSSPHESRGSLIGWIDSPLGFFTLALLICESFLAVVLTLSRLAEPHQFAGMWGGAAMFLFVGTQVFVLVCWKPENLVFDRHSHLSRRKSNAELAEEIINTEYTTYMGQKDFVKAEFACEKALQYDGNNERAKLSLALAKTWSGKHEESIELLDEVIAMKGRLLAKAYFNRGCVRVAMSCQQADPNRKETLVSDAIKDVRKAIKLAPYYRRILRTDEDMMLIQDALRSKGVIE